MNNYIKGHLVKLRWLATSAPRRVVLLLRDARGALISSRCAEAFSAIVLIAWGEYLHRVPQELHDLKIYYVLAAIIPNERVWVCLAKTCGLFQLIVVYYNWPRLRILGCLTSGVLWSLMTVGLYLANPRLIGIAAYAGYAAMNLYGMVVLVLHRKGGGVT